MGALVASVALADGGNRYDAAAWCLQKLAYLTRLNTPGRSFFPDLPRHTREIAIPTSAGSAPAVVYLPPASDELAPVHVNFHGGGYVMPGAWFDDALCRYLAAEAGVVVVNVDYVLAPQHRFPAAAHQALEVVAWVAEHGADHGWDGGRLSIGGQSAGGALAASAARQALALGAPTIALQVLHYPPLDLVTPPHEKHSPLEDPLVSPALAEVFDNAYVPDPERRRDPLVSPAHPGDTADLTGIAPALVITPEWDTLRDEGVRYAERLRGVGALAEHLDVAEADHAYDMNDEEKAGPIYAAIARWVREVHQK